jgi:hypothetical protein
MRLLTLSIVAAIVAAVPVAAQRAPDTWDGLTKVKGRADALYLLPDADFSGYTKVILDRTEVAFKRNWQRDYNRTQRSLGARIDDREAAAIAERARTGFEEIFAEEFRDAGYQVVAEPAADVLRLRTGVLDLYVAAPDQMLPGRTHTFSAEAGEATVFIEARDSLTGALLGRAVDQRLADDNPGLRTRVSNIADFEQLFHSWARSAVRGLNELKARSPGAAATGGR